MANPYDQFEAANPYDQFGDTASPYDQFDAAPAAPQSDPLAGTMGEGMSAPGDALGVIGRFWQSLNPGPMPRPEVGQRTLSDLVTGNKPIDMSTQEGVDEYLRQTGPGTTRAQWLMRQGAGMVGGEGIRMTGEAIRPPIPEAAAPEVMPPEPAQAPPPSEAVTPPVAEPAATVAAPEASPYDQFDPASPQAPGTVSAEEFKPTQDALGAKPGLTEPVVDTTLSKNVVDAADELLRMGGVRRDPSRLVSDQIFELLQTNRLSSEKINNVLNLSGTNVEDFAKLWRGSVSVWARNLQALSAVEQRLKAVGGQPGAEGVFQNLSEAAGIPPEARGMSIWRRVDNIRRGLLVTQLATAVRNAETQVGRVGLDVMDQAMQGVMQKTFGAGTATKVGPLDGLDALVNMAKSPATKRQVDYVLSAFPKEQDMLFSNFASDVARPGGPLSHVEKAVNVLNVFNRSQEFIIRRAIFAAKLDQQLASRGLSLDRVVKEQRVGEILPDELNNAIHDSLEQTWSKSFPVNTAAGSFINMVNKTPGASLLAPFPRYMMNSLRFQYQFSPAGYLRLLNPATRDAIAKGDYSAITRATVGTAMLLAAYQFRNSDMAGEKWYEIKDGDRRIDMRPFAPFSSYLFVADLAKRMKDGTINQLATTDILSGVLGSTVRAGVGLYAVDQVLNDVAGLKETGDAKKFAEGLAGNTVGGFTTPLATVKDFIAQFDESQRVVRDTTEAPFSGNALRNVPYANDSLPPVEIPTQEQPVTREAPAMRQLTGLAVSQPRNPVQMELNRLGFSRKDILPSTGDPIADRMLTERMGKIVQRGLGKAVESPGYQAMNNQAKSLTLEYLLKEARKVALDSAKSANPALFTKLKVEKGLDTREKRLIESLTGQPFGGDSVFKGMQ